MHNSTIYLIKTTIFSLTLLPFLFELFAFIRILRYRKQATNISKNNDDSFRAIKLRYTNSSKLNIPIRSSKSFVQKVLLGKDGQIAYIFILDKLALFISFINIGCSTIFAIKGHTNFTYIITIITISFYLFRQACALENHCDFIASMIEDYLDNTLYHRIKPAKNNEPSIIMPVKNNEPKDNSSKDKSAKPSPTPNENDSIAANSNHIIESILHEFLS